MTCKKYYYVSMRAALTSTIMMHSHEIRKKENSKSIICIMQVKLMKTRSSNSVVEQTFLIWDLLSSLIFCFAQIFPWL
jgi:hypothetical protein